MTMSAHLEMLNQRHRQLDEQINEAIGRPGAVGDEIRRMKIEKLRLKEEIERLRQ